MVDQRALEAAHAKWLSERDIGAQTSRQYLAHAIEAYEAALWRPIEEAPQTRERIVVFRPTWLTPEMVWSDEIKLTMERWISDGGTAPLDLMFRTIDPPSPVSTSPAAEDAS